MFKILRLLTEMPRCREMIDEAKQIRRQYIYILFFQTLGNYIFQIRNPNCYCQVENKRAAKTGVQGFTRRPQRYRLPTLQAGWRPEGGL